MSLNGDGFTLIATATNPEALLTSSSVPTTKWHGYRSPCSFVCLGCHREVKKGEIVYESDRWNQVLCGVACVEGLGEAVMEFYQKEASFEGL